MLKLGLFAAWTAGYVALWFLLPAGIAAALTLIIAIIVGWRIMDLRDA